MDRASIFEQHRKRLMSLAYRMIGSLSEAEDIVQEASLRWLGSDAAEIRSDEAWLVSVTTRLSIDRLRHLALERSTYVGQWLPEPFLGAAPHQPEHRAELASDLSMAFLIVLEHLAPEERAVFMLHEVFGWRFADIATTIGKSEAACRQMGRRARQRVRADRPTVQVSPAARRRLAERLLRALEAEDVGGLMALMADDAILRSDGGGAVKRLAPRGINGADNIARLMSHTGLVPRELRHADDQAVTRQLAIVNGEPGILTFVGDTLVSTMSIKTDGRRVLELYLMFNPAKLGHVRTASPSAPA